MALTTLFTSFLYHNPLFIVAFLMGIVSGWSSCHVLLKLARAGYTNDFLGTSKLIATLPSAYLRVRASHGWPAWPGHLILISSTVGVVAFAVAIYQLIS